MVSLLINISTCLKDNFHTNNQSCFIKALHPCQKLTSLLLPLLFFFSWLATLSLLKMKKNAPPSSPDYDRSKVSASDCYHQNTLRTIGREELRECLQMCITPRCLGLIYSLGTFGPLPPSPEHSHSTSSFHTHTIQTCSEHSGCYLHRMRSPLASFSLHSPVGRSLMDKDKSVSKRADAWAVLTLKYFPVIWCDILYK